MKYLARSASVLSEADRFEIQMNAILFTAEQDARIWAPRVEGEWYPGDPLYRKRGMKPMVRDYSLNAFGYFYLPVDFEDDFEDDFDVYDFPSNSFWDRCQDCEVYWDDETPCWSCGVWPNPIGPNKAPYSLGHSLLWAERTLESAIDEIPDEDLMTWLRRQMAVVLREEEDRQLLQIFWGDGSEAESRINSYNAEVLSTTPPPNVPILWAHDHEAPIDQINLTEWQEFILGQDPGFDEEVWRRANPPLPEQRFDVIGFIRQEGVRVTYPGSTPITEQRRRRNH